MPCREFHDVIDAVVSGAAAMGVLPVRNNSAGIIPATCGLLARAPVSILDELALPISHALIAGPGLEMADVTRVSSHPVALAQCRHFLARNPTIEAVERDDTAGCVEWVMAHKTAHEAAIASVHAARLYGASVLAERIEDIATNATTFVLIEAAEEARGQAALVAGL
jgi:prephenate dehydratase